MMIRVQCSSCHKMLKMKEELAGKRAKCPACGQFVLAAPLPPPAPKPPSARKGPPPLPSKPAAEPASVASRQRPLWPWFVGGGAAVLCLVLGLVVVIVALPPGQAPPPSEAAREERREMEQARALAQQKARQDEEQRRAEEVRKKEEQERIAREAAAKTKKKEEERAKEKEKPPPDKPALPTSPTLVIECPTIKAVQFQPGVDVIGSIVLLPIRYTVASAAGPLNCQVVAAMRINENGTDRQVSFSRTLTLPAERTGAVEAVYLTLGHKQVKAGEKMTIHLEGPNGIPLSNTLSFPVVAAKRPATTGEQRPAPLKSSGTVNRSIGRLEKGAVIQGSFHLDAMTDAYTGYGHVMLPFQASGRQGMMVLVFSYVATIAGPLSEVHLEIGTTSFSAAVKRQGVIEWKIEAEKRAALARIKLLPPKVGDWVQTRVEVNKGLRINQKSTVVAVDENSVTLKTDDGRTTMVPRRKEGDPLFAATGNTMEVTGAGKEVLEVNGKKLSCDWIEYNRTLGVGAGAVAYTDKVWICAEVPVNYVARLVSKFKGNRVVMELTDYGYGK